MRLLSATIIAAVLAHTAADAGEVSFKTKPKAVRVTVSEPAGVARKVAPVTGGIPFKKGQVKTVAELALFDKSGKPVPAQFSKLAGYGDGSVQWALVDFMTNVAAGSRQEFLVKKGKVASPACPLKITENDKGVTIETGAAKFVVDKSKREFALLESVELGGAKVAGPGALELVNADGRAFKAGKPTRVSWEYRGPLRATLRVEGCYIDEAGKPFIFYTARLTFWAGLSLVRVVHSLRNFDPKEGFDAKIKQATVSLAVGFKGNEQGKGPSWIGLGGPRAGLLVATRHAGGCFPGGSGYRVQRSKTLHKLSREGGAIKVFVVPAANTPPIVSRGKLFGYEGNHFGLADRAHKDTEMWLEFYAGKREAAQNESRRKALLGWLHALADPTWISETEVMGYGKFGTLSDEIATYKKWGWKGWNNEKKYPRSKHEPDAYVAKEYVHDVSEADNAEGLLLMYLRTGQRGYLDWGRAWAEFNKTHYAYRTDGFVFKGKGRKSSGLEVGWYKPYKYGWNDSRAEASHFYARGIFDWYCLTGDVDALEGGRDLVEQAEWSLARYYSPKKGHIGYYGVRDFARLWLGPIRLAQLTGDKKDLALAERFFQRVMKASDWDERGFIFWGAGPAYMATHSLRPEKMIPSLKAHMEKNGITLSKQGILTDKAGNSWPVRADGGTWQQAALQEAMERYWRLSKDKQAKKRAIKMAEFTRDYQWSKKSRQTFYYTLLDIPEKGKVCEPADWDPETYGENGKHSGHYTCFSVGVFSRAYSLTGDPLWLDWAKKAWNRGSKRGYLQRKQYGADDEVWRFAWHIAPKDDKVLHTARMFFEIPRAK